MNICACYFVINRPPDVGFAIRDCYFLLNPVIFPGPTATDFFNKANMNRSKILQEKLSDPADVARDEFEALMRRDDKVISGFKNKVQRNEQSLDRQSVRPQNGRNAETGEPLLTPV